jgi:hypothetical protein
VVSAGAPTPALFGFQSPGDYATFNSNHTPDGTVAARVNDYGGVA